MDNFKKAYDLLKAWKGDSYICGLGCLEEIAHRNGLISRDELASVAEKLKMSDYGKYLMEYSKGK